MSNDAATTAGAPIIFDGWRSISTSLYMALVGYSVMVSVPVLSTALVDMLGFSAQSWTPRGNQSPRNSQNPAD